MSEPASTDPKPELPLCFVIMPISDHPDYPPGHFKKIYTDITAPACRLAGFEPIRADDVCASNMIHLDILQKLLEAPMAVCDLSSANPNVLFELGLRQAFDKPVALIQEQGARAIFDIALIRYAEYRKERIYDEVPLDQNRIAQAIKETSDNHEKGSGVNSIVKLLSLTSTANIPASSEVEKQLSFQKMILDELASLRNEVRHSSNKNPSKLTPERQSKSFPIPPQRFTLLELTKAKVSGIERDLASTDRPNRDAIERQIEEARIMVRSLLAEEGTPDQIRFAQIAEITALELRFELLGAKAKLINQLSQLNEEKT